MQYFIGRFKFFNYLQLNGIQLNLPLWLYAIYGHNTDIIHLLEEYEVDSPVFSYIKCYKESIKCHHIDFMDYIKDNLYQYDKDKKVSLFLKGFRSYNFIFFH